MGLEVNFISQEEDEEEGDHDSPDWSVSLSFAGNEANNVGKKRKSNIEKPAFDHRASYLASYLAGQLELIMSTYEYLHNEFNALVMGEDEKSEEDEDYVEEEK